MGPCCGDAEGIFMHLVQFLFARKSKPHEGNLFHVGG